MTPDSYPSALPGSRQVPSPFIAHQLPGSTPGGDGKPRLGALVPVETVLRVEILPAEAGEDGTIHISVQLPQSLDVGVGAIGVMEKLKEGQAKSIAASLY